MFRVSKLFLHPTHHAYLHKIHLPNLLDIPPAFTNKHFYFADSHCNHVTTSKYINDSFTGTHAYSLFYVIKYKLIFFYYYYFLIYLLYPSLQIGLLEKDNECRVTCLNRKIKHALLLIFHKVRVVLVANGFTRLCIILMELLKDIGQTYDQRLHTPKMCGLSSQLFFF